MLLAVLSLVVSLIPPTLLFCYLRNLRGDDPGYRSNCGRLLRNGILCSVGVALLDFAINIAWSFSGLGESSPLLKKAFSAFVVAAFAEELVKYLTANRVIKKNIDHVSWLDCIAYTAIVGTGFQMIETVVYMIQSNPIQILVRGFTMGHPSYGMLMGYFIGKALYEKKRSFRADALWLPMLLHGIYNFSLADELEEINDNLVVVPFIAVLVEAVIFIRILLLIKKERRGTKYTQPLLHREELPVETGQPEP
ncbi:MAG: PrsW family intramembrane metalloprotease [Clostridia bacterium]|nr:PrsW family intramembrane metalloprotease [Clostridia bacterium]